LTTLSGFESAAVAASLIAEAAGHVETQTELVLHVDEDTHFVVADAHLHLRLFVAPIHLLHDVKFEHVCFFVGDGVGFGVGVVVQADASVAHNALKPFTNTTALLCRAVRKFFILLLSAVVVPSVTVKVRKKL